MAAKEEKKPEGEEAAAETKPKGKKKLIIIIVAAVVVLGGGGGAAMMMMGGKEKAPPQEVEKPPELKTAELGQFIVNLSDSASFIKLSILIEYDNTILSKVAHHGEGHGEAHGGGGAGGEAAPPPGGLPPAIKEREPMIKDSVIQVLSSKKAADVLSIPGKETLKEELLEAINDAIGFDDAPVTAIYFTEFIVQ